jgi:integrase
MSPGPSRPTSRRSAASPTTAHNRHRGLHAFYGWLDEEDDLPSPMAKMKPPAVPDQPVPVLTEPQLRALFAVCGGKDFEGRRDIALLMVLLDAGPRRSELLGMRLGDLDFEYDVVRGRQGRAGAGAAVRPQDRPGPGSLPAVRSRHRLAHLAALWISQRGPLTISRLRDLLDRRARQATSQPRRAHGTATTPCSGQRTRAASTASTACPVPRSSARHRRRPSPGHTSATWAHTGRNVAGHPARSHPRDHQPGVLIELDALDDCPLDPERATP